MSKVLSVTQLCKTYGEIVAVDGISFDVGRNEIVGLLGPNGAGKTTTINMILGVLAPASGRICIEGVDIAAHRSHVLQRTNFAAVYAPLPGNLTVWQNLRVFGLLYGVKNLAERIEALLQQFDLEKFRDVKCGVLSSGEQTRVSLAKAMLNSHQLLLLDEPTASLDPAIARDIRNKIRDFAAQGTGGVLWTSHNMYEVEEVCGRVLFLSRGRILLEGDPKTLPREHGKATLEELFRKLRDHTSSKNVIVTPCITRIKKSHRRTAPRSEGTKLKPEDATVLRYFVMNPQSTISMPAHTNSGNTRDRLPRMR